MKTRITHLLLSTLLLCGLGSCQAQPESPTDINDIVQRFQDGIIALDLPQQTMSYEDNLNALSSSEKLTAQRTFFEGMREEFEELCESHPNAANHLDVQFAQYFITLNLSRIAVGQDYRKENSTPNDEGIFHQEFGPRWYAYYLQSWIDLSATPKDIFAMGEAQVADVQRQINAVRESLEMDSTTFYAHLLDPEFKLDGKEEIEATFQHLQEQVEAAINTQFYDSFSIAPLDVAYNTTGFATFAPAFYSRGNHIFYYNLTKEVYLARNLDWLYLHEGVPGHHFQAQYSAHFQTIELQGLLPSYCYKEGWAAYCEVFGEDFGVYATPYHQYGRLNWDLIRSVRVVLDVGLNYYGWTNEKALAYWKANIPNQDDVAMREIQRMRDFPAQVITYKYGAAKILEWRKQRQEAQGAQFDIRAFHHELLSYGPLPLSILEPRMLSYE